MILRAVPHYANSARVAGDCGLANYCKVALLIHPEQEAGGTACIFPERVALVLIDLKIASAVLDGNYQVCVIMHQGSAGLGMHVYDMGASRTIAEMPPSAHPINPCCSHSEVLFSFHPFCLVYVLSSVALHAVGHQSFVGFLQLRHTY